MCALCVYVSYRDAYLTVNKSDEKSCKIVECIAKWRCVRKGRIYRNIAQA